jgi:VPDSG-CTERM motif
MKLFKYTMLVAAVCTAFTLQPAKASIITTTTFSSELTVGPNGTTGDFGTVDVSLTGDTATITFTSNTAANFFFIDSNAADVNLNTSTFTESIITDASFDSFKFGRTVNGFGAFDLNVINSDGTGSKVSTISFSVTSSDFLAAGFTASDVLDVNDHGFDAAAHVVDFNGTSNPPTFFVAEAPGQFHVPDGGATAALLGLGMAGLAGIRARFGRK